MRSSVLLLGLLGTFTVAAPEEARAGDGRFVFVRVDAIRIERGELIVKGALAAGSGEWRGRFSTTEGHMGSLDACVRLALLAMDRPEDYRLELDLSNGTSEPACGLARAPRAARN